MNKWSTYSFTEQFAINALQSACRDGDSARVSTCLKSLSCDVMREKVILAESETGRTALSEACHLDKIHIIPMLLNALPSDEGKDKAILAQIFDNTLLHYACSYIGNDEMVFYLMNMLSCDEARAQAIQVKNVIDLTPLHGACKFRSKSVVSRFINVLPNGTVRDEAILAQNTYGRNALHETCKPGGIDVASILLNALSSDIARAKAILAQQSNESTEPNVLLRACSLGDCELVFMFLEALPSDEVRAKAILAPNQYGWNALHFACRYGSAHLVAALLDALGARAYAAFSVRINLYYDDNDENNEVINLLSQWDTLSEDEPIEISPSARADLVCAKNCDMHMLDLIERNESPPEGLSAQANREQIVGVLKAKFPEFFDIYEQRLVEQSAELGQIDKSAAIKQAQLQLSRAASIEAATPLTLFGSSPLERSSASSAMRSPSSPSVPSL